MCYKDTVCVCGGGGGGGGQHSKSLRWHYEKRDLTSVVDAAKLSAKEALQTVYDALNTGQKKQIIKNETVKALLGLHGVVRK